MDIDLSQYPFDFRSYVTRGIIWGQRKLFCRFLGNMTDHSLMPIDYEGDSANEAIASLLKSGKPCLVSRFGSVEIDAVLRGYDIDAQGGTLTKIAKMALGKSGPFWWDNSIRRGLLRTTGVFPVDDMTMMRFSRRVREDCRQIDILGTWNARERMLWRRFFPAAKGVPLGGLDPFFATRPWTRELKGKKVLVVHSFTDTISAQYQKREKLFANQETLPEFELIPYRSVTSYLGIKTPYRDWFEALDKMCADIAKIDFDVAILGCGAYGMSIGAFVKRGLHRQALHLGGVSQILFGIKGGRWDVMPEFAALYNDAWTRPFESERPEAYKAVERGCYW